MTLARSIHPLRLAALNGSDLPSMLGEMICQGRASGSIRSRGKQEKFLGELILSLAEGFE
jgi:hypothetical protein